MALFGKTAEEKAKEQEAKTQKMLARYGLSAMADRQNAVFAHAIMEKLTGTDLMEAGMKIGMARPEAGLPVYYQRAILEQNWIIIRQLDKIAKLLEDK